MFTDIFLLFYFVSLALQTFGLFLAEFPACRHVLVFLAFLGFVNVYALRVNLSVAIVSMVKPIADESDATANECPGQNNSHHHQHSEVQQ